MARLRIKSAGFDKRKIKFGNVKRKTVSQRMKRNESFLAVLLVFFMCTAGVCYLLQTNALAIRGYEVQEYENRLDGLKKENEDMKNREAELKSIKNLEEEKGKLCSVSSSDIDYVSTGGSVVVLKK